MVLCVLGSAARSYMTSLNTTRVEGAELMASALRRPVGQALITVSNHVAALDDPLVVSALLPEGALQQPGSIRYEDWAMSDSWGCAGVASWADRVAPTFRQCHFRIFL